MRRRRHLRDVWRPHGETARDLHETLRNRCEIRLNCADTRGDFCDGALHEAPEIRHTAPWFGSFTVTLPVARRPSRGAA